MKHILVLALTLGFFSLAHAEQSTSEKAASKTRDVTRMAKKTAHKAKEMMCAEGDAKCMGEKAKHRAQEGADYVNDKTKDAIDKVDSDSKAN